MWYSRALKGEKLLLFLFAIVAFKGKWRVKVVVIAIIDKLVGSVGTEKV